MADFSPHTLTLSPANSQENGVLDIMKNQSYISLVLFLVITGQSVSFGIDLPQSLSFQGRFLNATGTAPLTEIVSLNLGIYSADGGCLLYEELQRDINLSATEGGFSIEVGSPLRDLKRTSKDFGLSMSDIFANTGRVLRPDDRGTTQTCNGGYSPQSGEERRLHLSICQQHLLSW